MAYVALWVLTLLRLWLFPRNIVGDLSNHQRAPGFFTIVAGTCILGTQNAIVVDAHAVASALWFLGLGLWFVVMYAFFTAVTIRERKPSLAMGINGAWLIAAVATQSIVVLRGTLGATSIPPPEIQFLCLAMFMIGCMLYLAIIPMIFYRLTFVRLSTHDFSPPYWINMGAVAITTLAGSTLVLRMNAWSVLQDFGPFLKGFTLFFWAAATWWIPFLIALMIWRYLVRRDKLRYEPQLWGMVFPSACTRPAPCSFRARWVCHFLKSFLGSSYSSLWRLGSPRSQPCSPISLGPFWRCAAFQPDGRAREAGPEPKRRARSIAQQPAIRTSPLARRRGASGFLNSSP